jgi:ABC-2 type transport system permease protein
MSVWYLARALLRIYVRDRQSMFFALFFPLFFMLALGYGTDRDVQPLDVGVVVGAPPVENDALMDALRDQKLLDIAVQTEGAARRGLVDGDLDLVLLLPDASIERLPARLSVPITVLVDAAQPQRTQQALTILRSTLDDVEHEIRNEPPLFALHVEDVRARNARYIDFLIPGLLAFMVLQLSIAGSGFNIVEYKRKGILKRLFVTPLRPAAFIAALVASRLAIVLAQISLLLLIGYLAFHVTIQGNLALLYVFVVLGTVLFLGFGFALGGLARTQSAVMALGNLVIFPQVMLAGIFFPIDALPAWLHPVATILPLNFVSDALRRVANEGAGIADLGVDVLGICAWGLVGGVLAVRLFRWSDVAIGSRPRMRG